VEHGEVVSRLPGDTPPVPGPGDVAGVLVQPPDERGGLRADLAESAYGGIRAVLFFPAELITAVSAAGTVSDRLPQAAIADEHVGGTPAEIEGPLPQNPPTATPTYGSPYRPIRA
jgi:hypothetical protein